MRTAFVLNDDIEDLSDEEKCLHRSIGEDPQIQFKFGFFRRRYLGIILRSDSVLDARVYMKRVRGYNEKDSVGLKADTCVSVIIDAGKFGIARSFRLDPASSNCTYSLEYFEADTLPECEAQIRVRGQASGDKIDIIENVCLPRLTLSLPGVGFARRKSKVEQFVQAQYKLAEDVPPLPVAPTQKILLSIVVPVFNAPARHLNELLESYRNQAAIDVELILSDDASNSPETIEWLRAHQVEANVKIVISGQNGGIAVSTNNGLAHARGTWVTFLDHDDVIAPHALKLIARAIAENPGIQFLYTDEVVVDDKLKAKGIMLKPAYDPVLLTGVNYINHFSIYRRDRLNEIGQLRTGMDGSQDYDLLLRYLSEIPEEHVFHLPYPAYWWRRTNRSFSRQNMNRATEAARKAIKDTFDRRGLVTRVEPALTDTLHRVVFDKDEDWPHISIIIPSRNAHGLIKRIVEDIFEKTDYPNFEVIIIDNGSTDREVLDFYEQTSRQHLGFSYFIEQESFNFSRAINKGIGRAKGVHYLILNNDVEVIDPYWMKEMVSCLTFDRTGIVGAKLLYPNGKIQHAGVIVGFGGLAGHWYLNQPPDYGGPMNRLYVRNSMTCVTAAVMLISGECARELGPWDEENFAVAYNDVDYCMRAYRTGFRTVWTPFACLYHHESVSRGTDVFGERRRRFDQEKENLRRLYKTDGFIDPALNPGYNREHSLPSLKVPEKLDSIRTRW